MAHRRISVLHAIQNLNYGGMERLFADIVRLLDRDRFESHVLAMQYFGRFADGMDAYATMHLAPPMGRSSMLYPRALAGLVRQIRPDVVHTHSGVWFKVSLASRLAGVPRIIHTEHGRQKPDPASARLIGYLASRRTDVVAAVSAPLAEQLRATVVSAGTPVVLVPNGVDTALRAPRADTGKIRNELGIGVRRPVIGSIGRLEYIKGYDVMIEAFALLRREWSGSEPPVLVVAGEGSERPNLEARIDALGLRTSAFILGWRDDVVDLHSSFTLFTMSSRSEGTSVSLLEAMSTGLCPVVTDVGGNAAVLGPALAHRLVPSTSATALAAAWREALNDEQARASDAEGARRRVESEFGLGSMVHAYEALYVGGASGQDVL